MTRNRVNVPIERTPQKIHYKTYPGQKLYPHGSLHVLVHWWHYCTNSIGIRGKMLVSNVLMTKANLQQKNNKMKNEKIAGRDSFMQQE